MKKYLTLILTALFVFTMFGCQAQNDVGTTKVYLPFSVDQIDYIEMFHYTDDITSAEKKIVTDTESIRYLHGTFERLSVETLHEQPEDEAVVVTALRFYLSNSTEETFEIIYYGYGVQNGVLKMPPNEIYHFTSADIGWIWSELDVELEAVPANEDELPK